MWKDGALFGHVFFWEEPQDSEDMKKDKDLYEENVIKIMREHVHM